MRTLVAALAVMTAFPTLADEVDDARRLAVSGRDDYWNCLAREYPRDANKNMPEQEFAALIAAACASERQNFRVALVDYLGTQPGNDRRGDRNSNGPVFHDAGLRALADKAEFSVPWNAEPERRAQTALDRRERQELQIARQTGYLPQLLELALLSRTHRR